MKIALICISFLFTLSFLGCTSAPKYTEKEIQTESKRINAFFERVFNERVSRSPMWQTYLGIKDDYEKLDDISMETAKKELEFTKSYLKELKTFEYEKLDEQAQLSYKIFELKNNNRVEDWKWRYHNYPVNQMFGMQSNLPAFMINMHQVKSKKEAEAYISRLNQFKRVFDQLLVELKVREEKNIIPPKFVFPKVISDSRNIVKGYPFTKSRKPSPIFKDFKDKVAQLKLTKKEKIQLEDKAQKALLNSVLPAYKMLISYVQELEKKATTTAGIWKLESGDEYYNNRLQRRTTTEMTAAEVHQLGLKEVERIHNEMKAIMKVVKYDGTLQEFFKFVKTDKKFYFNNTKADRQKYLDLANKYIADMKAQLPKMFNIQPKASLNVKPVEEFREKSAGLAFYSGPAPDGSRPGIYYVNLYDMTKMSSYEAEALAYHEGIPGHHMQIAISTELQGIPKFRRFGGFTAYGEGWGLYSEYLPKEFGFYKDPYSDFGRLTMELWRACRLVVDTGIHFKKWTREQAIDYLKNNTPNPDLDIVKAIERYIVMPGQATAYKVGMLKILELRDKAKIQLGDKFDIRQFHDVILRSGAVPLSIMDERVSAWIQRSKNL